MNDVAEDVRWWLDALPDEDEFGWSRLKRAGATCA
jgi:hypothetical protein